MNIKCLIRGHKTILVETEPHVKIYDNGESSKLRTWVSHIECTICGKKWYPPSDEEIRNHLSKLKK